MLTLEPMPGHAKCILCKTLAIIPSWIQVSSFNGSTLRWTSPKPRAVLTMNLETIQVKIAEEMKKAKQATDKFGKGSREAALAWDIVEELEAEASHIQAKQVKQDPLDVFCEDKPEADECRVYEN